MKEQKPSFKHPNAEQSDGSKPAAIGRNKHKFAPKLEVFERKLVTAA